MALDADTHFQRDSIFKLVRWFHDPSVAAVAGNAKVGNRINTITRWQALEYVTSQNLEPGPGDAIGAWRREAIEQLGGFPVDTLAEDQDLTIGLLRAVWRVLYDSTAIGWTEAPDSLRGAAQAAVPLDVRHAAMLVEAPPRHIEATIQIAWSRCFSANLAVPGPVLVLGRRGGGL